MDAIICGMLGLMATFVLFLLFCTFVVVYTGDTKGLRDVAIVMKSFPILWGLGRRR